MGDTLLTLANDRRTRRLVKWLGLPTPVPLAREAGGYRARPLDGREIVVGTSRVPGLSAPIHAILGAAGARVHPGATANPGQAPALRLHGVVFDATGMQGPEDYALLYAFFHPLLPQLDRNARVVVLAALPEHQTTPAAAGVARGLEGFVRTLAKETGRRGANANLLYVAPEAASALAGPLVYFCGPRCTYVDGQAVRVRTVPAHRLPDGLATAQLAGRTALVTGAARGIGAATAQRLAEEGAHVVCVDIGADRDGLYETALRVGGTPLVADVADPATPARLCEFVRHKRGGLDIVVHNAGITSDRTLARMSEAQWSQVLEINFGAIVAIDAALLAGALIRPGGRVICLSSMAGVAGNFGQTNYATSKAALIGYVAAQARSLADQGITVNAVAPGFIETRMTAAMPMLPREIGRRMSSLAQGGQPRDVAELITFLATPAAAGIQGETLRVCGQNWLGA